MYQGGYMNFYDRFISLCNQKGVSPSRAAVECNVQRAAVTRWKTGSTPRDAVLHRMSDYFGVSIAYLLGADDSAPAVITVEETKKEASKEAPVDGELIRAIVGMSEAEQQQVLQYIRFLKSQR